jgi:predicted nucleic acid-binding protein
VDEALSVKEYVLDANALLRYFQDGAGAETIEKLISRVEENEARLSISAINLGEVLYTLAKSIGLDRTKAYIQAVDQSVETVSIDEEFALAAAIVKFQYKMGYADSIAALLAMRRQGTLVTADPGFAKLGRQLKVLALPRHSH